MKTYIHVLIVEDDPFASDIMMMLLARDYRTRVTGELSHQLDWEIFKSLDSLRNAKKLKKYRSEDYFNIDPQLGVDCIILDTEVPWDVSLPLKLMESFSTWEKPPKVLCTSTYPNISMLEKLSQYHCFSGYLVKHEILYAIASAACLASAGYYVLTPKIDSLLVENKDFKKFSGETLIVSLPSNEKKRRENAKLKKDVIRLNLIFNLSKFDIEDELATSQKYIAQIISEKYEKLEIADIVLGDVTLDDLFRNEYIDNQNIITHYKKLIRDLPQILERRKDDDELTYDNIGKRPKFRNMGTLAFHLMTRPKIEIKKW